MARTERIEFPGAQGDQLAARLEHPDGPAFGWAIFAHCFSCSKDIAAAQRVSRRLTDHGLAVLRFDFTGLGHSEGDFANTNFSSNVDDLIKAAEWLGETHTAPSLLIGHSLGGAAVIAAAAQLPSVRAVATIGAPADAEHVQHQFHAHIDEINEKGEAEVSLAGRPFKIKKQFLDDISGKKLDAIVGSMRAALLIAHSPIDATVGIDNATRLFVAAKHPKTFISLDQADHLLTSKADAEHIADVIGAWSKRYISVLELPKPPNPPREKGAVVEETGLGGFYSWVNAGGYVSTADEPLELGGLGGGPGPYEILSASLAACTTFTLRMYAKHKGYDFGRIKTEVHHRVETDDAGEKRDVFERLVSVENDVNDAMGAKILEIANKCPVHKTLERSSHIETRRT